VIQFQKCLLWSFQPCHVYMHTIGIHFKSKWETGYSDLFAVNSCNDAHSMWHTHLSVCSHTTTLKLLNGCSWNLTVESFNKMQLNKMKLMYRICHAVLVSPKLFIVFLSPSKQMWHMLCNIPWLLSSACSPIFIWYFITCLIKKNYY
jgi:hypothetical protein